MDISNFEEIKKLEKKWSEQTYKDVMSAVQIAQSEKSDIFGFGEVLNRKEKKAWEKVKTNWNHTFANSQVDVKVESFLRRSGMRMNPYLSEVEKNRREE